MFQGFSQGAIDFLWGIRFNNERGWFLAHKEEFLTLVDAPMRELAAQVSQAMTEEFPKLGLELKESRIYRDARRLFGRGPYKDHLWFSLRRRNENEGAEPSFYFEIAPEYYSYGMGAWDLPPVTSSGPASTGTQNLWRSWPEGWRGRGNLRWRAGSISGPRGTRESFCFLGITVVSWSSPATTTVRAPCSALNWRTRCWRGFDFWCPITSISRHWPGTRLRLRSEYREKALRPRLGALFAGRWFETCAVELTAQKILKISHKYY